MAPTAIANDLDQAWEVLAEAIQTVMRAHGLANPYEKLKTLTRGHSIGRSEVEAFVESLDLPKEAKARLHTLTPTAYTGNAAAMAKAIQQYV